MNRTLLLAAVFVWCGVIASPVAAQDSAPAQFLAAWVTTTQNPPQAAAAWETLAAAHKDHELGLLAKVMLGMVKLRDGAAPDAMRELFVIPAATQGAKATELRSGVTEAGNAMLARLAMNRLSEKLRAYYTQHVEYPATLGGLVETKLAQPADIIDPFGKPYGYEARARRLMPDVPRQTYALRCDTTQTEHGPLREVLATVTGKVTTHAISSLIPAEGQAFIRRVSTQDGRPNPAQRWNLGQTIDDMTLWAVYDNYLIAGWRGLPRIMVKE